MNKSNYAIIHQNKKYVYIEDLGPWNEYMSVTNNAENVVKELIDILNGRRLFYKDSEGDVDEIVIKDGKFSHFSCGGSHGHD